MARLFILLLVLPYWAYFPIAAGIGYLAEKSYKSDLENQRERALALEEGPPALVDLSQFNKNTHISPIREVNIEGWINNDYNYNLTKSTNMVQTGERFMYLLFGQDDTVDTKVVRAALVFTEAEKDTFVNNLGTFSSGLTQGGNHLLFNFNGFASVYDGYGSLVTDAIKEQHLRASPDFVYIKPFFGGREAVLAPHGLPGKGRLNTWLFAVAVALFGIARYIYGRMRKKARTMSPPVTAPAYTQPSPRASSVGSIQADNSIGSSVDVFGIDRAVPDPVAAGLASGPAKASVSKDEKKFPVKLAMLTVIVVATALKPTAVFTILPLLIVFGFWAFMFGGVKKINELFNGVFPMPATKTKKASLRLNDDPALEQPQAVSQHAQVDSFHAPKTSKSKPPKPAKRDSFADGPIQSGSGGLFGRSRRIKRVDPFEKLATERKSF